MELDVPSVCARAGPALAAQSGAEPCRSYGACASSDHVISINMALLTELARRLIFGNFRPPNSFSQDELPG